MKRYYATLFDSNYISYGCTLISSINNVSKNHTIFVFCFDEEAYTLMQQKNFPNVILITIIDLVSNLKELIIAQKNRTRTEFFYTCSPAICKYVLDNFAYVDLINYLDSDLYFFSSPEPIFNELDFFSIGIIEHRFSTNARKFMKYGRFNVGWITFRNDIFGKMCLNEWYLDCISWCYQRIEDGKYADQKYLESWPNRYNNKVRIIENLGANLAIWNINNYLLTKKDHDLYIEKDKLIFYHFAGLNEFSPNHFSTRLSSGFIFLNKKIKNNIYIPFLNTYAIHRTKILKSKKNVHLNIFYRLLKNARDIILMIIFIDYIYIKQKNDKHQ